MEVRLIQISVQRQRMKLWTFEEKIKRNKKKQCRRNIRKKIKKKRNHRIESSLSQVRTSSMCLATKAKVSSCCFCILWICSADSSRRVSSTALYLSNRSSTAVIFSFTFKFTWMPIEKSEDDKYEVKHRFINKVIIIDN